MKKGMSSADVSQLSFELVLGPSTDATVDWDRVMSEVVKTSVAPFTGKLSGNDTSDEDAPMTVSAERAYPHIYDAAAGASGAAMSLVAQAKREVGSAIDAWSEADLQGVSGRLAQLAVTLSAAHRHTQFSESFGAAVSFMRRAALHTNREDVDLAKLMLLAQSLTALYSQPMLTLDGATDLIEKLQDAGWNGQNENVAAFVMALLGSSGEQAPVAAVQPQHASQG